MSTLFKQIKGEWWLIATILLLPTLATKTNYILEIEEVRTIEMMESIENYILGRLSKEEIDQLWIEFLKDPDLYLYFETYLNLLLVVKKR